MHSISRNDAGKWELKDATGKVVGSFDSRSDALGALDVMLDKAFAELPEGNTTLTEGARFEATFNEGEQTVDNRIIELNATNFERTPPLPWMFTNETSYGHEGAVLAGVIEETSRNGSVVVLRGRFDTGDAGVEAERMVREKKMTRWSPDFGNVESTVEVTKEDPEGFPIEFLERLMSGTILGGTQVPFPALSSAEVRLIDDAAETTEVTETPAESEPAEPEAEAASASRGLQLVASAVEAPVRPPAAWFEDPQLDAPTPITVTEDGRIFGHIAQWNQCHIGRDDICVEPPASASDYAYFRTGEIITDDNAVVPTGVITMGTGHAPLRPGVTPSAATEHYDNTGTAVADVIAGEDTHGPWIAGAIRPGVSAAQLRALRGSALSGDWRRIAGTLELVAALAVNVPGFPIPRPTAMAASGQCEALVAAGAIALSHAEKAPIDNSRWNAMESQIKTFQRVTELLAPVIVEQLEKKMHPTTN